VDSVLAIRKGLTGTEVGPNLEPFAGLVGPHSGLTTPLTVPPEVAVQVNAVPIFKHERVDGVHGAIFNGS